METELEQLRQQLAAANARVAQLEQMAKVGEMFMSLFEKAADRPVLPSEALAIETTLDWIGRAKKAESTIAACKAAGFVTEQGEVRRVLGTLPITADGCVAGMGCELWADFNPPGINAPTQCAGPGWPCVPMTRLYGSREAAEAAKGGREG